MDGSDPKEQQKMVPIETERGIKNFTRLRIG